MRKLNQHFNHSLRFHLSELVSWNSADSKALLSTVLPMNTWMENRRNADKSKGENNFSEWIKSFII